MKMKIAFWLPRNPESVSVARHTLDRIFTLFGVRADCRDEIALAVSEACSNAVRHASGQPGYQLSAESQDSQCVITVDDDGPGMEPADEQGMPAPVETGGRGLAIIRTTTDTVQLRRRRTGGFTVRMSKTLRWQDGALGSATP